MNIGVILEYFRYFLPFDRPDSKHAYFYTTARQRFRNAGVSSLTVCDHAAMDHRRPGSPAGEWMNYFKPALVLGSLDKKTSVRDLAAFYEQHFEFFLRDNRIDVLISGGTSGFERCGMATAQRMGIKTLFIWEGFFRPHTVSYDRKGMNAESEFASLPFQLIEKHVPTSEAARALTEFRQMLRTPPAIPPSLKLIQGHRFDVLRQLEHRWTDRNDVERIRLPLQKHLMSRIAHLAHRVHYGTPDSIDRPFIFFPLQTHTDSNVALHCSLFPYASVVDNVLKAFSAAKSGAGCDLIVKEHPLDVFRTSYAAPEREGIRWMAPEVPTASLLLHPQCKGTILVNSTAGIESMALNIPVLALGRSLYARPELTENADPGDVESIAKAMIRLPSLSVDENRTTAFLSCLYDRTQRSGNLDELPDPEQTAAFEDFLEKDFRQ